MWCRRCGAGFCYAQLQDGREAHHQMQAALQQLTYTNLFVYHPVFEGYEDGIYELDGNTGMAAGILEMLLQSHDGVIHLLPALPPAWTHGHIAGVCARGGFEVEMQWEAGAPSGRAGVIWPTGPTAFVFSPSKNVGKDQRLRGNDDRMA